MRAREEAEVREVMAVYFEGLHHSDSRVLRQVFHRNLLYVNATPSHHECLDLDHYMARIDARRSPASRGDPRQEVIERVTVKGGQMGLVEARMTMLNRAYQDLLTLIHTDDGWKVIAKVFSFVEKKE
ncbi:MAG: nuclear transport factor 2 family protein [Pseudomonadota bacterium]